MLNSILIHVRAPCNLLSARLYHVYMCHMCHCSGCSDRPVLSGPSVSALSTAACLNRAYIHTYIHKVQFSMVKYSVIQFNTVYHSIV